MVIGACRATQAVEPSTVTAIMAPSVEGMVSNDPYDGPIFENHGSEFWLHNQYGQNLWIRDTSGADGKRVYQDEGLPNGPIAVSEAAKRCMKQGSDTLKSVLANP